MTDAPQPWTFITERRLNLGENIQEFADKVGIARPTLSLIESGHSAGRPASWKAIADRLGMTVVELLATRPASCRGHYRTPEPKPVKDAA